MASDLWSPTSTEAPPRKRTLVLCFDGTGNEFSDCNTNVIKLFSILKKDDPGSQLCYYQPGIGTYFKRGAVPSIFHSAAELLDKGFAWYIDEHILDGYKFLMQNYHKGDSVCIFGFSRGAFTARALVGMLHKVGLLSKDNFEQLPFAYKIYTREGPKSHAPAAEFKRIFGRELTIDFLGVWDTVASVGHLRNRSLPIIVGTNKMIKVFRQALSLDERRVMFRPSLYHYPAPVPSPTKQTRSLPRRVLHALNPFKVKPLKPNPDTPHHHSSTGTSSRAGPEVEPEPQFKRVKEVWFVGCHSDIGGGNPEDSSTHALSNISLRWMVREIATTTPDIDFNPAALKPWNIPLREIRPLAVREASEATVVEDPALQHRDVNFEECDCASRKENTSTHTHTPTCGGKCSPLLQSLALDEALDARDVVKKKTDEVGKCLLWWVLEIWPTYRKWQDKDGQWVGQRSWHLARGRELPPNPVFHKSVGTLMKDGYAPRAPLHNDEKYEE